MKIMLTLAALSSSHRVAAKCTGCAESVQMGIHTCWQQEFTVAPLAEGALSVLVRKCALTIHCLAQPLDWDTANNPKSPHDYTASSGHRAHWLCDECGHEWQASISNRVKNRTGCPYCASIRGRRRLPTVAASSSSVKQYWDSQRNAEQGLDPD